MIHMKKILAFSTAAAMLAGALPAFAAPNDILIRTVNSAEVLNSVSATASTGSNTANGGSAASTLNGGNISDVNFGNEGGNGGTTVLGGLGGMIKTGDALATASVENTLNSTSADVEATPWAVGQIRVRTRNTVSLMNEAGAGAASGDNVATGAGATNNATGGNVDSSGSSNTGGNGGGHVEAGGGGFVGTGAATSHASIVNILNANMTRIRR